ncbi:MAG: hypothetical protein BMS9Abin11_1724 [Gammaproteobacteria bacterium]|nr:MAG: hypothetical protein BMS9Abin11_1724 [Gammaproteobacteria bacterium]
MKTFSTLLLALCMLSFTSSPATAANPPPGMEHFNRAGQLFRTGNYKQALRYYRRARETGLAIPELAYNLGVTYYKLGRNRAAEAEFRRLLEDRKWRATVMYNLGLVRLRLGDKTGAIRWFQQAHQYARGHKLKLLAASALKQQGAKPKSPPWRASISVGAGYDDNAALNAVSETDVVAVAGKNNSFVDVWFLFSRRFDLSADNGFRLDLDLYSLNYDNLSQYDYDSLRLDGLYLTRKGGWRLELGPYYKRTKYGGVDFQKTLGMVATGRYKLAGGTRLRLRYRGSNIDAINNSYAYLDGARHQFGVRAGWRWGRQRLWAYYTLELNDRADLQNAAGFTSYSATRHKFRVRARQRLFKHWFTEEDLQYRYSQYNDATTAGVPSPVKRQDDRYRLRLKAGRRFGKKWLLSLEYKYTSNESNIDSNDYKRNLYTIGVRHQF